MSGRKSVALGTNTSAATHAAVSNILIPWGAIVIDTPVIVTTAFNAGTSSFVETGTVGTLAQADASSATADPNGFMAGAVATASIKTVGKYLSCRGGTESLGGALLGTKPSYTTSQTYSSSGEKVVPVVLQWTHAGTVPSTGVLIWWVEYIYDPNIVWTQDALA
tara:strand:- start:498 stop:989 length:492 start_codon:yes stop_codon:yes gene_type:complete